MKKDEIQQKFNNIAAEYNSQRRKLIPCFDDFYSTIVAAIPAKEHIKVLDVGAGTGLLSSFILERFPNAEVILIDISVDMLAKAKERFRNQNKINYIQADYATYSFSDQYDIIVSSLSIHHLEHEEKKKLYGNLFKALSPSGLFINGDQFHGRTTNTEAINQEWWRKAIESTDLSTKVICDWKERVTMDIPATVSANIVWLEEAGFIDIDLIYKMYNFGIITAYKGD